MGSPTTSCLETPPAQAASDLVDRLCHFKGRSFRIGHIAEVVKSDLAAVSQAVAGAAG